MMIQKFSKWLLLFFVGGSIIALDQVSKLWIIDNFLVGQSQALLSPFLQITRSSNTGIAFGIGAGGSEIFLVLSLLISSILLFMFFRSNSTAYLQQTALALVLGGAIGNVIDRIQHGYVVDFVHISIPNLISNVSNFADHAVVIGVILLIIDGYLQERSEAKEKAKISPSPEILQDAEI